MPTWMQWINLLWPIAMTITPIMVGFGFLWLKTKFAALGDMTKLGERVTLLETTVAVMTADIKTLDETADSEPTRLGLMNQLSGLTERMSRMEAAIEAERRQSQHQFEAVNRQLSTSNSYLHTIIEQGMLNRSGQ